jgi:hypothetical protein
VRSLAWRRRLGAATAILALGLTACGIVGAQPAPTSTPSSAGDHSNGPRGADFQDGGPRGGGAPGGATPDGSQPHSGPPDGSFRGGGPPGGGFGQTVDVAAQALGLSADQLRTELTGSTLTAVAQAHNVDPSAVASALRANAAAGIERAVAEGRMTTDQASQARAGLDERVNQQMARPFTSNSPGG